MDRRDFVRVAVGGAAAGAVGAAGLAQLRPSYDPASSARTVRYPGARVLPGSPAPVGLPMVPLRIDDEGVLNGVPDAAEDQRLWYLGQCRSGDRPWFDADRPSDDRLRFNVHDHQELKGQPGWWASLDGQPMRPDDFPDAEPNPDYRDHPGVGALATWRSEDLTDDVAFHAWVLRLDRPVAFEGLTAEAGQDLLDRWTVTDPKGGGRFIAYWAICPHECCVTSFHQSPLAKSAGFPDTVFCTCHLDRFDPWTIGVYELHVRLDREERVIVEPFARDGGS